MSQRQNWHSILIFQNLKTLRKQENHVIKTFFLIFTVFLHCCNCFVNCSFCFFHFLLLVEKRTLEVYFLENGKLKSILLYSFDKLAGLKVFPLYIFRFNEIILLEKLRISWQIYPLSFASGAKLSLIFQTGRLLENGKL